MKFLSKIESENPDMYDEYLDNTKFPYRWLYEQLSKAVDFLPRTYINPDLFRESLESFIEHEFNNAKRRSMRQMGKWNEKRCIRIDWKIFRSCELYDSIIVQRIRNIIDEMQGRLNMLKQKFEE